MLSIGVELSPIEQLLEGVGSYTAPQDPQKVMWDFYCLYTLCYRYGQLWSEYHSDQFGQSPIHPPVYARVEQWVNEAFFTIKEHVKTLMLSKIPLVCLSEAFHFLHHTDEFESETVLSTIVNEYKFALVGQAPDYKHVKTMSPEELRDAAKYYTDNYVTTHSTSEQSLLISMLTYVLQVSGISNTGRLFFNKPKNRDSGRHIRVGANAALHSALGADDGETVGNFVDKYLGGQIDMAGVRDLFLLKWHDSYGGPAWYHICNLVIKLQQGKKAKDDAFHIDQLYDAQHNTGTLFSKIPSLYVPAKLLDIRAFLQDPRDFEPYVSDRCRAILVAFSRFIQADVAKAGKETTPVTDRLEIVRPTRQAWAMANLENGEVYDHTTSNPTPGWYLELINTPDNDTTFNDVPVKGQLLQGLKAYQEKYGKEGYQIPFMFQLADLKRGDISRFIPAIPLTIPTVAARTRQGWKLHAPGFACDGQVWPLNAFEPYEPNPMDENLFSLNGEPVLYA
jgi:hypothetical protein